MTYQDAAAKLTGRNSQRRKVGNNTYLERRGDDAIALRLHSTDILTYYSNGDVLVTTGGWLTVTTKARLNEFMPYGIGISQSKGQWYVSRYDGEGVHTDLCLFEDALMLHPDGTATGGSPIEDAAKVQKLRKQARAYAKRYVKALRAGEVKAPSAGDCWGCLMVDVKTGKAGMGGAAHILSHIEEDYFVPSLLLRALETFPSSIAMKDQVARIWSGDLGTSWGDFIFDQIEKNIYRYCLRELGQAT